MCGGGGSSSSLPILPTPEKEAETQILIMKSQFELDQQRAALEAEAEIKRQAQISMDFNTNKNTAWQDAYNIAVADITRQGLDASPGSPYETSLRAELDRTRDLVLPINDPSPGTYFAGDFGQGVLDDALTAQRSSTFDELSSLYAPGFANKLVPDTLDDTFIADILGSQQEVAQLGIQRALDRGNLNQTGYDAAIAELANQSKVGEGVLGGFGQGFLEADRNVLRGIADQGFQTSQFSSLNNPFDVAGLGTTIGNRRGSLSNTLEGRIRGASSGENFFSLEGLINKGGTIQGAQNDASISNLLAREEERKKQRGLGSQGVF